MENRIGETKMENKELSNEAKEYLELHRVQWKLVQKWHPNFNTWACYNKADEYLYEESFPKHINPNLTYPCGQLTIIGLVPIKYRDAAYTTSPVEREGFRHD